MTFGRIAAALALAATLAACGSYRSIPGTTVEDTRLNREVLEIMEEYRRALEERNPEKLLALAHPRYVEDSGTPLPADDYGYEGLKLVLQTRLQSLRTVRYMVEYRKISVANGHAEVDIRYDASFQIVTAMGDRWEHKQSDKRITLERDNSRWLIIAGM
jgi:hypothetical protein